MGIGILNLLDLDNDADSAHAVLIIISLISYICGAIFSSNFMRIPLLWRNFCTDKSIRKNKIDFQLSIILYVISGTAVFLYFQLVGYNVFLSALLEGLSGDDVKDMRLASYAGDTYYAPGYFNQFKNILAPVAFLAIAYYIHHKYLFHRFKKISVALLALPVLIGLLGTGQRAFLIAFLIVLFIFFYTITFGGVKIKLTTALVSLSFFLALFSASSFFLGRSDSFTLLNSLEAIFVRIFNDNQMSAVIGYRYVYDLNIQFGREWWTDLIGILPGEYKGSDLANRVHSIIYGSDRGTSPVSLWGSVYHNWGWFGIVICPIIMSFAYSMVSRNFLKNKHLTPFTIAAYSYIFFILGSWIASGPMQLINNGLLTLVILLFIIKHWRIKF